MTMKELHEEVIPEEDDLQTDDSMILRRKLGELIQKMTDQNPEKRPTAGIIYRELILHRISLSVSTCTPC